eukprot:TRINITY_DN66583_c13_g1_i1.p1 TRINITY_DN66583_c13_g1~~TRINITY_DN66583_c13_g1_i1.p1  ORF type:complete len:664 (+),score=362.72 TRINITY_DN66583_c13_g1_i1:45-1994(+)
MKSSKALVLVALVALALLCLALSAAPRTRAESLSVATAEADSLAAVDEAAGDWDHDWDVMDSEEVLLEVETGKRRRRRRRRRRRKRKRKRHPNKPHVPHPKKCHSSTPQHCGPCPVHKEFGSVHLSKVAGKPKYTFHKSPHCVNKARKDSTVAWGVFDDTITSKGWATLSLRTSSEHSDLEQAYAAGFLEGAMTHHRIWQLWKVIKHSHTHDAVYDYFEKQDSFLREKVSEVDADASSSSRTDSFWYNVGLVLAQMDGVLDGYNSQVTNDHHRLSRGDMWLMNSDGDIMDVERAATPGRVFKPVKQMSRAELVELISMHSRCSALIKWTGDDLFAAHTTWDDYSELIRIYKHYHFAFKHSSIKSQRASFSGYPALVSSSDDFYVLDTGLTVIETTLNILDESLYDLCDPSRTVLAWVRNIVANRMATTGKHWTEVFALYNSGTYNDQWMIVDYNKFQPGSGKVHPGVLYIMEQVPGFVESKDMSHVLQKEGYWASYNRPFFAEINKRSFYAHFHKKHGEMFSYQDCPRARIFKREQKKVKSLDDMKRVMMHNDWQNDPYSKGCPGNAIAARFDIETPGCKQTRVANGATDSKITNYAMSKKLHAVGICGPSHQSQEPFSWDNPLFRDEIHDGQPTTWNFSWMPLEPHKL